MDSLFELLPVLLIYLLAAFSSSKKKKKAQNTRRRSSVWRSDSQGEKRDIRTEATRMEKDFPVAFGHKKTAAEVSGIDVQCEDQPLHFHEAAQLEHAQEGEDPCHAGGYDTSVSEEHACVQEESLLAQDVLRGVIMSEILLRPHERRALRRNRQGYHG